MTEFEKFINNQCPDGVVYKRIASMAEVGTGSSNGNEAVDNGTYPFFIRSSIVKAKDDYEYDEEAIIIPGEGGVGDIFHYVNGKYALHQRVYRIHFLTNEINAKFVYYYMQQHFKSFITKKAVNATVTSIRKPMIEEFLIPVPPLEVQREIVRVLDSFTFLSAELSAELQARKKQYEYYRELLLTKKDANRLGKIIDMLSQPITDGPHITPVFVDSGIPFLSAEAIHDGKIDFEKKRGFITKDFDLECCKKYKPQKNDVFMVKSGSTTGKVGYVDTNEQFNIWSPIAAMRTNVENSSRFLFHLLQSNEIQKQVKEKSSHGSQPNLSMRILEQFEVVIPPLEIQNKIADVLDNFDAICNDLNIGLPAEIEARQKQYEYYRDMLLTFAETGDIMSQTDRQTDRQAIIRLLQYIFGYAKIELGDIGKVSMCKRILKAETSDVGDIPFYKIGTFGKEADAYIDREKFEEYKKLYCYPKKGEVLISAAGTIGRTVIYDGEDAYYQDSNIVWIENDETIVLNRYLFYCYQLKPWTVANGGTIARLYNDILRSAKIIVPSLAEQERIVSILDRFDALCNDLSTGLPAEIEMRQKQYECYRDKLLSFKAL